MSEATSPVASWEGMDEVSIADIHNFLAVLKHNSVTLAAQERNVSQSKVSKTLASLERRLQIQLFVRGGGRLTPTDAGRRVATHLEEAVRSFRKLHPGDVPSRDALTVAGPSALLGLLLPLMSTGLSKYRFRALEWPAQLIRSYVGDGAFDVAFGLGQLQLPRTWHTLTVGTLRRGLFTSPETAERLGSGPLSPTRVKEIPFVTPVYYSNHHFIPADDGFPGGYTARMAGDEVTSLELGLKVAARTGQLIFCPVAAAREWVGQGALVEISLESGPVLEPVLLGCNGDRVTAPVQNALIALVRQSLDEWSTENRAELT